MFSFASSLALLGVLNVFLGEPQTQLSLVIVDSACAHRIPGEPNQYVGFAYWTDNTRCAVSVASKQRPL